MWSVFFCPSLCVSLSYRNAAAQAVGGNNLIKYERTSNELRKERGSEKKRRGEVPEGWCVCVQKVMQLINLNTLLQRVMRTLSKFDVIVSHCVSCLDRQRRRDSNDRHSTGQIATWDRIDLPNQQQKPADSVWCWWSLNSLLWQEHPGVCDVKLRKEIWRHFTWGHIIKNIIFIDLLKSTMYMYSNWHWINCWMLLFCWTVLC